MLIPESTYEVILYLWQRIVRLGLFFFVKGYEKRSVNIVKLSLTKRNIKALISCVRPRSFPAAEEASKLSSLNYVHVLDTSHKSSVASIRCSFLLRERSELLNEVRRRYGSDCCM